MPLPDSRKPTGESGICLPVMCRPIGVSAWTPAADPARNPSDAVSVEVVITLALQLPFMQVSESMGNHDSKIVDAASVD